MALDCADEDISDVILENNPTSVLSLIKDKYQYFYYNKASVLDISGIKFISIRAKHGKNDTWLPNTDETIHWHSMGSFDIGDKCLLLSGKSTDYQDLYLNFLIVYSGKAIYNFSSSEIFTLCIRDDYKTIENTAQLINQEKDIILMKTAKDFDANIFNGIQCPFFENEDFFKFFKNNVAIKSFKK
ncbi:MULTISPECIES: hypothetical protein [unclassified Acinetobacter]|uniref:hypothetical protein n=1 Tax=unclassified Acinetobacter TaxID=196816 RepID=UPI0035B9C6C7